MAQIKWTIKADRLFEKYVLNAFLEYGTKTSKKWMQERIEFANRVAKHPESYPPKCCKPLRGRFELPGV